MKDGTGVRVLVADDDGLLGKLLTALLTAEGYTVLTASDGMQVIDIAKDSSLPLVIMLNLRMSRLNSIAVLQAIASEPRLAAQHSYILLTATAVDTVRAFGRLLAQLTVAVVPKPFDIGALLSTVAQAAARLASTEELAAV